MAVKGKCSEGQGGPAEERMSSVLWGLHGVQEREKGKEKEKIKCNDSLGEGTFF